MFTEIDLRCLAVLSFPEIGVCLGVFFWFCLAAGAGSVFSLLLDAFAVFCAAGLLWFCLFIS